MALSKSQFSAIMKLLGKHDWLKNKSTQLTNLLYDDCENEDEQNLVTDLLDRFVYVTAEQFVEDINSLVLEIVTTPNINPENTIVAAMAADSSPDSSQFLVHHIKGKLQDNGWGDVEIVNTFGAAFKYSKKNNFIRNNIILVDEFVGSGRTALGRVNEVKNQFHNAKREVNVFVKVVFSSVVGSDYLAEKGVNFSSIKSIKRGISDFETAEKKDAKINLMLDLEKRLSATAKKHKLDECSLGYGKAESLFSISDQNIPNNVFPIFWWPKRDTGLIRAPLFTRWIGD